MSDTHPVTPPNPVAEVGQWPAFAWDKSAKDPVLQAELNRLTAWHASACAPYRTLLEKWGSQAPGSGLAAVPFLPVRLFKHERLLSVPAADVVKTMTSSGTSGQNVSQIFLDKTTAALQVRVLSRIMADFIGPRRLPMLVIDCRATVHDRTRFSARAAGILGFSMFGRDVEYALDDDMTLNLARVRQFLDKHAGADIFLFGFTFMVWLHFVQALEAAGQTVPLERGILVHGGGWKQLQAQAVSATEFKVRLNGVAGLNRVHNYYGMVEQTGSIFMECEAGHLHSSAWSDVIIRDPLNFSALPVGQPGLIQLLSVIPHSYPGHSLLSEDWGELQGVDDCSCGRKGSYFAVHGRIQNAETRGCSDTYSR